MSYVKNCIRRATGSVPRELRRLLRDESGVAAVEYGLLVALITLAVLGTIISLGDTLSSNVFGDLSSDMGAIPDG